MNDRRPPACMAICMLFFLSVLALIVAALAPPLVIATLLGVIGQ